MHWTTQRAGRLAAGALLALSAITVAPVHAAGLPLPPTPPPPASPPVAVPSAPPVGVPPPPLPPLPPLPPIAPPAAPVAAPVAVSGLGAGEASAGASTVPVIEPAHPAYQASPEEQAALPDEPGRTAYEQQQLDTTTDAGAFDATLGEVAIGAGGGSGRFGWPVVVPAGRAPITQRFGCTDLAGEPYRAECPKKRWHAGLDLGEPAGTPVFAADTGVVHVIRSDRGYGNHILLIHGNGYATLYGHLSTFAAGEGQVVKRGEMIGQVGSTGFSTGPHLHFEIRYQADAIDPCAELGC